MSKKQTIPFLKDLSSEFVLQTSRSSGPGGQNVNKVNTKVELRFNVPGSNLLNDHQKQRILSKLSNKINQEGWLIVTSQSERTQMKNKVKAEEKFYRLIRNALKTPKKRVSTRPGKAAKEKRLEEKRQQSEKKSLRKNIYKC